MVKLFGVSPKSRMYKANKVDATYVLLIGDEEQASRQVMVKHMTTSTEQRIAQDALVNFLRS